MKIIKLLAAAATSLLTTISVAQTTEQSPETIATMKKIELGYHYYKKTVGQKNIKECEIDAANFYNAFGQRLRADAADASSKTTQAQLIEQANTVDEFVNVTARSLCFYKFYVEIEDAYFATFNTTFLFDVIDKMLSDDLTDKRMNEVKSVVIMPMDDYLPKIVMLSDDIDNLEKVQGMENIRSTIPLRIQRWEDSSLFFVGFFEVFPEFGCKTTNGNIVCD